MHNSSNMRNKQMAISTCQILPFFKISLVPAKWPLFLDFANSGLPLKKYPFFFAKMGTSVVYVLVGSRGGGWLGGWDTIGPQSVTLNKYV